MKLLLDSFWRALLYSFYPRVWLMSLLPLLLMVVCAMPLGYFFWDWAVLGVQTSLESSELIGAVWGWFQSVGLGGLKSVVAPLIVIALSTPVIVVTTLMVVALLMTPAIVSLVASRRFAHLQERNGASWLGSLIWSVGSVTMAVCAMLLSMPLWVIPPLALVLPPLIWGWLCYRILAFDALARHASKQERLQLFQRHRTSLLGMGLFAGYLGGAPSLLWASAALWVPWFVILLPLVIWLYTFTFALTSLWFTHFCLAALEQLRAQIVSASTETPVTPVPVLAAPNQTAD
jgi:hypothetical protein